MNRIPVVEPPNKCSSCALGRFCLPLGLNQEDSTTLDSLVTDRIRLQKGETLYRQGDPLNNIYGVRFGTLKTEIALADGREQVTGFFLPGEFLGLGGMGDDTHQVRSIALEDSEVCPIRLSDLESLARRIPSLQHQFHRIMSQEINQNRQHMLALGSMRAEERLANFLLSMSDRLATRGYSPHEFILRMSREDLGSYLGMKIETVSRLLSRFGETGLIQIKLRHVKLVDISGLSQMAGAEFCAAAPA
jgi:CRP/FNR family transcriptional regulator